MLHSFTQAIHHTLSIFIVFCIHNRISKSYIFSHKTTIIIFISNFFLLLSNFIEIKTRRGYILTIQQRSLYFFNLYLQICGCIFYTNMICCTIIIVIMNCNYFVNLKLTIVGIVCSMISCECVADYNLTFCNVSTAKNLASFCFIKFPSHTWLHESVFCMLPFPAHKFHQCKLATK